MYISVAKNDDFYYEEGFVVRFLKSNGTEWVANFKTGRSSDSYVIPFKDSENVFVFAKGICYIMNKDNEKPLKIFNECYNRLYQLKNEHIVLENYMSFTIVEDEQNIWDTEYISDDGFIDIRVDENKITGKYLNLGAGTKEKWEDFEYDIKQKKLKSNWGLYFLG